MLRPICLGAALYRGGILDSTLQKFTWQYILVERILQADIKCWYVLIEMSIRIAISAT